MIESRMLHQSTRICYEAPYIRSINMNKYHLTYLNYNQIQYITYAVVVQNLPIMLLSICLIKILMLHQSTENRLRSFKQIDHPCTYTWSIFIICVCDRSIMFLSICIIETSMLHQKLFLKHRIKSKSHAQKTWYDTMPILILFII